MNVNSLGTTKYGLSSLRHGIGVYALTIECIQLLTHFGRYGAWAEEPTMRERNSG